MNYILLLLINIIHFLLVLFVIIIPFLNINILLILHFIIVPFIIFHWIINDNNCVLTIIEKKLRCKLYGIENANTDCFTCKLIEPIYDFNSNYNSMSQFIYLFTIVLWLLTTAKLYLNIKNNNFDI